MSNHAVTDPPKVPPTDPSSNQPAGPPEPPKVPPSDPSSNQPAGPPEPPKVPPPDLPSEPGPTGPFSAPGGMVAPQAPNNAPRRTEVVPDGITSATADLGAGYSAPQAPGPEIRTDQP